MRFFKSKFFIICVTVALVLAIVTSMLSMFGYSGIIRSGLKTLATPFEWCGTTVANAVNGFVEVFAEYDDLKKENAELRARLEQLENEQHEIAILRDQNDWLKSYLDLKSYTPDLSMTNVTVIAREAGNYSTVLTINKASYRLVLGLIKIEWSAGIGKFYTVSRSVSQVCIDTYKTAICFVKET